MFRCDGRTLTPDQARDYLLEELARGHLVLPMSEPPCDGFSFTTGCPGHSYHDMAATVRSKEADRG